MPFDEEGDALGLNLKDRTLDFGALHICGATSVHVTKHLYEERLRDLVYMKSIYMK